MGHFLDYRELKKQQPCIRPFWKSVLITSKLTTCRSCNSRLVEQLYESLTLSRGNQGKCRGCLYVLQPVNLSQYLSSSYAKR